MLGRFSCTRIVTGPARRLHGMALMANGPGSVRGAPLRVFAPKALGIVARDVQRWTLSQVTVCRVLESVSTIQNRIRGVLEGILTEALWSIKRTFQPSLIRRKRKHGFLSRVRTRHGRIILARRRRAGKTRLCA